MIKIVMVVAFVLCVGLCGSIHAQDVNQRTRDLIAALDKTKYKKKEKKDIKIEMYVEVKNEPIVKSDPTGYSGLYESLESDYKLDLHVSPSGAATGSGYDMVISDSSHAVEFKLKDGRVDGALLTATKVFADGRTENLEAVFTKRTVSRGTNRENIETTDSSYGIGFIQSQAPSVGNGNATWTNRVFLEYRR